jgi:hypothetical protein
MKKQLTSLAILAGGFVIGASALVALADSTWTPAPAGGPPNNNVPAPINVGPDAVTQVKSDSLQINGSLGVIGNLIMGGDAIFNGTVKITSGTPGSGKVLTSDTAGNVSWGTVAAAAGGVSQIIAGTGISVSPSGGTGNVTVGLATPTVTIYSCPSNPMMNGSSIPSGCIGQLSTSATCDYGQVMYHTYSANCTFMGHLSP